jgi:two-component system sensor histidine kinase RpfC
MRSKPKQGNNFKLFKSSLSTEEEQAYVRLLMFTVGMSYIVYIITTTFAQESLSYYVYIFASIWCFALLTLLLVRRIPAYRRPSRIVHLIVDDSTAFITFFAIGPYAMPVFFTYLFVSIGYGLRYSLGYLIAGSILGIVLHSIAITYSPYDPPLYDVIAQLSLLLILPLYVGVLIHRLNKAREQTEHAYIETAQALVKAEEANRAKTQFLANISHDLRTPLVGVGTAAELMDTNGWSESNKSLLNTINNASDYLEKQIQLILDFAKSDSGNTKPEIHPVDLPGVLESCRSILFPQATQKGVSMSIDYNGPDCIETDESALRNVLMNMAGNALKFTEVGHVRVNLTHADEVLSIVIEDTGIGIPADKIDTVFEPFVQADGSMTRRYQGTGLGTSITKQLVEGLGGGINLSSVEGEGTVVSISLPAVQLPPGECAQLPADLGAVYQTDKAANILVADDNVTNRHIIGLVLNKGGYTNITIVDDGKMALEALQNREYQLAIIDRHMPEMDGGEVLATYKNAATVIPKTIFLTADQTDDAIEEYQAVGFDAFVTKPFKPDFLLSTINRLLDSR